MSNTIETNTEITNAPKKDYSAPMHTTEHILNRTMINLFNTERSFSAHVEVKKSKCDYHFDRTLTQDELNVLTEKVNAIIKSNLPVYDKYLPKAEAAKIADLSKLPENASDTLRLVFVWDYDVCPCIGVHVSNTSEIGTFKIISQSFEDGVLRLRWKVL